MRHLIVIALGALVGCASTGQGGQTRMLSFPLGSPRAACQGGEKSVKLDQTIQLQRRLGAGGEGCVLELAWEGELLDTGQLAQRFSADDSLSLARVTLRFEKLVLADEVGQNIDVVIPELTFRLLYQEAELLSLSGKATRGPWGRSLKVELSAASRAKMADDLRRRLPVLGKAQLRVELDEASRRALQRAARGPLFELHYGVQVEAGTKPKPAASQPAAQPNSPRSQPVAGSKAP